MVTQAAYMAQLRLPSKLFSALKDIANKRNSLHYLADPTASYNRSFVEDLLFIRDSFNTFIVKANNDLVRALKLHDINLKQKI